MKERLEEKFLEYIEEIRERVSISNLDMIIPYIPDKYLGSLLDYFSNDTIVFIDEPKRIEERIRNTKEQFLLKYSELLQIGEVLSGHEKIRYEYDQIREKIEEKIAIVNSAILSIGNDLKPAEIVKFPTKTMQSFHNNMELLNEELNHYKYRGYKVIIFAGSEERAKGLQAALMDLGLVTSYVEDYEHEIKSSQIFISPGSINRGFEYPDIKFAAISHKEIFKSTKDSRRVKKKI